MQHPHPDNAILAKWQETLRQRRSDPAILSPSGGTLRTFEEIEGEAATLQELASDWPAGSVVALQIGNHETWPALLLALFRRGIIPLPLGRHIESGELQAALETVRARALLTVGRGGLRVTEGPCEAVPAWEEPVPHLLKLTSGTTSAARGVRFRAAQLLADCDNICRTMGIGPDDINYGVIPFSHSYGFSNLLTPLICNGVTLVASDDRIPRAILEGIAASSATVFPGMPIFFDKLASLENVPALPHLRLCISAGAPLTKAVANRFTARYGLKVHTFYGSSECGGIGYDASDRAEYKDGFAGKPMHGVEITRETAEGSGRIAVSGPAVGDGYYPAPEPEVLGNGRFVPGDVIDWTAEGMWITGRASDLINVAGRKLNPSEVELRIEGHPAVRHAVVFGVPSALRGEEPILCVSGDALEAADVIRFCRANLSEWQVPRDVWVVSEIPVNERGKISRRQLAQEYLTRK